jgi:hypothetical protein
VWNRESEPQPCRRHTDPAIVPWGEYKGRPIETLVKENYDEALRLSGASWFYDVYPYHWVEMQKLLLKITRIPRDRKQEAAIRARMLWRTGHSREAREIIYAELGGICPKGVSGEVLSLIWRKDVGRT